MMIDFYIITSKYLYKVTLNHKVAAFIKLSTVILLLYTA